MSGGLRRQPHDRHIDGAFLHTIHPDEIVGFFVVNRSDLTAAQTLGHRSQSHALCTEKRGNAQAGTEACACIPELLRHNG